MTWLALAGLARFQVEKAEIVPSYYAGHQLRSIRIVRNRNAMYIV
jgi:hypothetical protein